MLRQPNVTADSGLSMDQLKNLKSRTHQTLFTTSNLVPRHQNHASSSIKHGTSSLAGPATTLGHVHSIKHGGQKNITPFSAVNQVTSSRGSIATMAQMKMVMDSSNRVNLCNESSFSG